MSNMNVKSFIGFLAVCWITRGLEASMETWYNMFLSKAEAEQNPFAFLEDKNI